MNCNTTHYRANSSSVPGDPTLFAAIIGGLIWGIATGQAMRGVLIGAIAGAVLALLFWLIDRRRRP